MKKISSQNAKRLAVLLDKVANLVEQKAGSVDRKLVASFVGACDRLADSMDALSKRADFDATTIGEEVGGPLESDSDEPWMKGEFTQEEFTGVQSVVASKKKTSNLKEGPDLTGAKPQDFEYREVRNYSSVPDYVVLYKGKRVGKMYSSGKGYNVEFILRNPSESVQWFFPSRVPLSKLKAVMLAGIKNGFTQVINP